MDAPAEALRNSEWSPVMEFADFPWVPVVDGDFLIELPTTSLKRGNFKVAELLIGSNLEEAIYFIVYQLGVSSAEIIFASKKIINYSRQKQSINEMIQK